MKLKTAVLTSVICSILSANLFAGNIGGYDGSVQTIGLSDFDKAQEAEEEVYSRQGTAGTYRNHTATYTVEVPTKTITVQAPPVIVTTPTTINNDPNSQYYQIKSIEFSGTFGTFRNYKYKGHKYEDFPMGETNGIRFRVRDWTIKSDDHKYNGKVSWNNGSFSGGNTKYSPGGFRMYGSGGWLKLEYKSGAYAKFKITKRADAKGSYIQFYNSSTSITFSHEPNNRRLCFNSPLGNGCVSYNIAFEAIP